MKKKIQNKIEKEEKKIIESPKIEGAMVSKKSISFANSVKELMDKCVKNHQHHHPLYRETCIHQHIIDEEKKIAAWVLFEQIDTDRCTSEDDGWLGDQYRYSVWYTADEKEPKQLYEDHAYIRKSVSALTGSRGRDCSIDLVSLDEEGVIARIVPDDSEGYSTKRKVRITKNGEVRAPEIPKEEKRKVDSAVRKKIISILKAWADASGNYSKSENADTRSSAGRSQIREVLRCTERGDWKRASEAYCGACSDFWDAGYDWDDSCGGYTLRELDATVSAIRAIAEGKKVSKDFMKE